MKTCLYKFLRIFCNEKKSYESTFHLIIPCLFLGWFLSQIKVLIIALDSSLTIYKREFSAWVSVALWFNLYVLVRCIFFFQLPLMKLNILLIMNNFKSSTKWKTILKEWFTLLIIYFFGLKKKNNFEIKFLLGELLVFPRFCTWILKRFWPIFQLRLCLSSFTLRNNYIN